MRMRALFWKIFLSFWLVQAAFIGATALLFRRALPEVRSPVLSNEANLVAFCARGAVNIYERSGSVALEDELQRLRQTSGVHLSIVDFRGIPISRAPLSHEEQVLAERALQSQQLERGGGVDKPLLADPIVLEGGYRVVVVAELPRPDPPAWPPATQPLRHLALGVVISGIVCFGLARYLTAPIERLRMAAQQLSRGDLSARAGKENERRSDEIADLVGDFDKMAVQIQSLIYAQRRLISDVSHEFRSPLTRINLALEPMRKIDNPRVATAIERVERETGRLDEMVRKLLVLSRLEAEGQLVEKSDLELDELLQQIVVDADFEAQAVHRRVVLRQLESCHVFGNKDMLRSAFENVIRNAIRYTHAESEVEVTVQRDTEDEGSTVTVKVRDHGPGVPPEALDALFRPFYRLDDSRERKTGGVGLGLSITKQAVILHGGRVEAANAHDGGLEITITLPAVLSTEHAIKQTVSS